MEYSKDILRVLEDWGTAGIVIFALLTFLKHQKWIINQYNCILNNHLSEVAEKNLQAAKIIETALGKNSGECQERAEALKEEIRHHE